MKVKFTGKGGYPSEPKDAIAKGLVMGQVYEVWSVDIDKWSSTVRLMENGKRRSGDFNTCMFQVVEGHDNPDAEVFPSHD